MSDQASQPNTNQPSPNLPNPPVLKKSRKSAIKRFLIFLFALVVLLGGLLGIIYFFGSPEVHVDAPHVLRQIFSSDSQRQIIDSLQKPGSKYSILWGAESTGIYDFVENFADLRASKSNLVIVRRIDDSLVESAYKLFQITKDMVEEILDLQTDYQTVEWVYIVKNREVPFSEIKKLQQVRPNDRILIAIEQNPSIQGFKATHYKQPSIADIRDVLVSELVISEKVASIVINHYQTVPQILQHLNEMSYSYEKHLGKAYNDLKDLGKREIKNLEQLCKKGKAELAADEDALEEVGAVTYQKAVYWAARLNKLNYEIMTQTQCVDEVASAEVLAKIEKIKEEEAAAEAKRLNDDEEKESPKISKKAQKVPPKAAKDKKQPIIEEKSSKNANKNDKKSNQKSAGKTKSAKAIEKAKSK